MENLRIITHFSNGCKKKVLELPKITVKAIASQHKSTTSKITSWIKQIYDDIFELNFDRPELFCKGGVNLVMHMKAYDNYCSLNISLPIVPRQYETVRLGFPKGRLGGDIFWVSKVEYCPEDSFSQIALLLEYGFFNSYRQFTLDKALFHGSIDTMDVFHKLDFEIDRELKRYTRSKCLSNEPALILHWYVV